MIRAVYAGIVAVLTSVSAQAEDIKLAVTTSFENSGLADVLLPAIKEDLDLNVLLPNANANANTTKPRQQRQLQTDFSITRCQGGA